MRLSLRSDILAVRYHNLVKLRADDFVLTFDVDSNALSHIGDTFDLADIAGPDWQELRTHLKTLNWLVLPHSPALLGTEKLSSVIEDVARGMATRPPKITLTADEALVIPDTVDDTDARRALRFFVGRLDWFRLKCYASLFNLPPGELQIWGDIPTDLLICDLLTLIADGIGPEPCTFRLSGCKWVATSGTGPGSLPPPRLVMEHAGDRLSAVEVAPTSTQRLLDLPGLELWMVTGQFALPNLRFTALPTDASGVPRWCVGTDSDRHTAGLKAVGEGVERFCLGNFAVAELFEATADSLGSRWLHPEAVANYSSSQRDRLGLKYFDESSVEWPRPIGPDVAPSSISFLPLYWM